MDNKKQANVPLTKGQLSLWVGHKLHPKTPLHNTAYSFDISGNIDTDAFIFSFQRLVDSVEAFRTIFIERNGVPYQRVLPKVKYRLEVVDFESTADEDVLQKWLVKRSRSYLDVSSKVFDSVLVRIGQQRYIWLLNMHHLVVDSASLVIVFELMADLYNDTLNGSGGVIEPTPSFMTYQRVEEEKLWDGENLKYEDYWLDKVNSLNKIPRFYGVHDDNNTPRSTRVYLPLGKERSKALKKIIDRPEIRSWSRHLSLFNLFLTLFFVYLSRISGQKRLAIGAPTHNRSDKNFQRTVGYFVEVFPLVAEVFDEDTFITLLNRVKITSNEYLKNARSGLTHPKISRSFNAVFNYINVGFADFNGLPTHTEWLDPGSMDHTHHLRCHVLDFDKTGEVTLGFDYNHGLFDEYLIKWAPGHFLSLLDAFLENSYQSVYEPSLVGDKEKLTIIQEPKDVGRTPQSLLQQFESVVKSGPNNIAIRSRAEVYTYFDFNQKIDNLASHLKAKGIGPGKRVALFLERSPEYLIGVLAVLKAGGTFIPIPSDQPPLRVSYILQDSECRLMLSTSGFYEGAEISGVETIFLDVQSESMAGHQNVVVQFAPKPSDIAYIIYTSGSTGNPKGVLISHGALFNYLDWAKRAYSSDEKYIFPLFTSIGFDLSITATFLPLITGGEVVVYNESRQGPDVALIEVLAENKVNIIKLTPSHLGLLKGMNLVQSKIRTMIVGGEDFKTRLAIETIQVFGEKLKIFNEYGPTEATVGCIVAKFNKDNHKKVSVPIGRPITNIQSYVLDDHKNFVPKGVVGELYLSGAGLAEGYANLPELTKEKFMQNPFVKGSKMYRTGDLVRMNNIGDLEYLGRADEQVKLRGFRIELTDIEANLEDHSEISNVAVVLIDNEKSFSENEVINCVECGLPSNYPNTDFDDQGVCHLCNAFKGYQDSAKRYFKTEDQLKEILMSKRGQSPNYDCLSLLSGGKDSTYILARLVGMGLKVLAFTLDNGYISEQAKGNIDKIVKKLGVDHIYGETPHMNKIFVDSLNRHQNVCNGCFKTIYTLSTKVALDKAIPFVITGLSRGQFFETRLTEELFWDDKAEIDSIDDTILEARKLYHQEEDAVKNLLDVSIFQKDSTFEKVQFVDFYRYCDVRLDEMLKYLEEKVGWVRPTDTGRSTNCLINQVGIYVHKKEKGYSNYSFPYSWDVRLGHKTRKETMDEINEVIDESEVRRIMEEIGYQEPEENETDQKRLVAYYTGTAGLTNNELAEYLKRELPEYMVPSHFKFMETLPLTSNGKVDRAALRALNHSQLEMDTPFVAPIGEIEELLAEIWKEVLQLNKVGVYDNFIALGGHSLAAIRITARINEEIELNFPLNKIFELPTIDEYAKFIEKTLQQLLQED